MKSLPWFTLLLLLFAAPVDAEEPKREGDEPVAAEPADRETDDSRPADVRLDEITIEGEVDVPRVLFIESRDRLRDADFLHHSYLSDVARLGRQAPLSRGLHWSPQGVTLKWMP
jgi:hypothetical protein